MQMCTIKCGAAVRLLDRYAVRVFVCVTAHRVRIRIHTPHDMLILHPIPGSAHFDVAPGSLPKRATYNVQSHHICIDWRGACCTRSRAVWVHPCVSPSAYMSWFKHRLGLNMQLGSSHGNGTSLPPCSLSVNAVLFSGMQALFHLMSIQNFFCFNGVVSARAFAAERAHAAAFSWGLDHADVFVPVPFACLARADAEPQLCGAHCCVQLRTSTRSCVLPRGRSNVLWLAPSPFARRCVFLQVAHL